MQSLTAELIEFDFFCEIGADDIFDFFADWWFECITVDFIEFRYFIFKKNKNNIKT